MAQAPKQAQQQGQQRDSAFTFEQFAGINTATVRAGVPDEQAYWLDNFMPLAPRQLRTLWGPGPNLYTAPDGIALVLFAFYNIGPTAYAVVFLSDGSVVQVDTTTGATTTILPAATIQLPSLTTIGVSQYGQQYLLIVSKQMNGYWVWDGSTLYDAGSLAPTVTLTNVGAGYVTPPLVQATGGHGGGATFAANVANGIVSGVSITNAGSGWIATDNTSSLSTVSLVFSGGTQSGSGASLTAAVANNPGGSGAVAGINFVTAAPGYLRATNVFLTNRGAGYTFRTQAYADSGNGAWYNGGIPTLQPAIVGPVNPTASISSINLVASPSNPSMYWQSFGLPNPSVHISDPGFFTVSSVNIVSPGSGYGPNVNVAVTGGGSPQVQAVLNPNLTGGSFTSVSVFNPGAYGTSVAPTLTVTDSVVNAAGFVSLMPFGISGSAVQTYSGHVWVFNGNVFNFTAPGSVSNFATSAGGGSDQSSDNFLKVGFTQAVQSNGFLFVIADSSMNYISGVLTSGTPPTTTFTNQNSDPEIGTPYPYAVASFGQDIFLANSAGIFVSSGGGFVKRSEALDGIYNTVPNFAGLQLSVAKATIFGKRAWMVLAPIIDPITGTAPQITNAPTAAGSSTLHFASVPSSIVPGMLVYDATNPGAIPITVVLSTTSSTVVINVPVVNPGVSSGDAIYFFTNKLLMTNGKQWWSSNQRATLTFINTQEINSTFTAWGTDQVGLFPLFAVPTTALTKTAQTKYWDHPGYEGTKTATRFWSLWQVYNSTLTQFTLTVDAAGLDANNVQFVNSSSYTIDVNGSLGIGGLGSCMPTISQAVGQQGILVGMTFQTNAADMALISAKLLPDLYQYRG